MLSVEERERVFGGPEGVAAVDAHIDALVAAAPPLTASQKTRLRALIAPSTERARIPRQRAA